MRRVINIPLLIIGVLSLSACAPITQVTNNADFLIERAMVADVEFTEHIGGCTGGCSTGFKKVPSGHNPVSVDKAASPEIIEFAELGPFRLNWWFKPKKYAVNIVTDAERVCAELWRRYQTDSTFNDDTTRVMITTVCR